MKYKPILVPIVGGLVKPEIPALTAIFGAAEFIVKVDRNEEGREEIWSCGKCRLPLRMHLGGLIPRACTKCGGEIDWLGILTRIVKVCPVCQTRGFPTDFYCPMHLSPAVEYEDIEVPL